MGNSSEPDLVKITEVFLIPCSFIVAALGAADTNPHRAGVSLIGLVLSVLWWVCSRDALAEQQVAEADSARRGHSRRTRIMSWLPDFFIACWVISLVMHLVLWNRPLGH